MEGCSGVQVESNGYIAKCVYLGKRIDDENESGFIFYYQIGCNKIGAKCTGSGYVTYSEPIDFRLCKNGNIASFLPNGKPAGLVFTVSQSFEDIFGT
jgi:hypothetical protein